MTASQHAHEWSKDALLNKAQRYAEIMLQQERDSWLFGFWSALTLEVLARVALAAISPILLADKADWRHLYFALGHIPSGSKFIPKSVTVTDVLERLESVLEQFTREMHGFSITHINRRNNELHSGNLAFDSLGTSQWLVHRRVQTIHRADALAWLEPGSAGVQRHGRVNLLSAPVH